MSAIPRPAQESSVLTEDSRSTVAAGGSRLDGAGDVGSFVGADASASRSGDTLDRSLTPDEEDNAGHASPPQPRPVAEPPRRGSPEITTLMGATEAPLEYRLFAARETTPQSSASSSTSLVSPASAVEAAGQRPRPPSVPACRITPSALDGGGSDAQPNTASGISSRARVVPQPPPPPLPRVARTRPAPPGAPFLGPRSEPRDAGDSADNNRRTAISSAARSRRRGMAVSQDEMLATAMAVSAEAQLGRGPVVPTNQIRRRVMQRPQAAAIAASATDAGDASTSTERSAQQPASATPAEHRVAGGPGAVASTTAGEDSPTAPAFEAHRDPAGNSRDHGRAGEPSPIGGDAGSSSTGVAGAAAAGGGGLPVAAGGVVVAAGGTAMGAGTGAAAGGGRPAVSTTVNQLHKASVMGDLTSISRFIKDGGNLEAQSFCG